MTIRKNNFVTEGMILSAISDYEGKELLNLIMIDNSIPAGAKIY